ncbi:MAG: DUF86 domain-containing protein [Chloroflexi bacterium]|nr:DUF86 domain-containing protein [Chloroflexota bacterium]
MLKDDRMRLLHMLDAAREALMFVDGRTKNDLNTDRMLVLSLVKELEIIGEAAKPISEITKRELAVIPWADIIGMRNRLVHAYFDIDLDILWQTTQIDLPSLELLLARVIEG